MQSRPFFQRVLLISLFLTLPIYLLVSALTGTAVPVARGKIAAVPLTNTLTAEQKIAQQVALADLRVVSLTEGRRTEVFGIRNLLGESTPASRECATAACYQVEIYNFDENSAVIAIVNVESQQLLDVLYQPSSQPGINKRLADLAIQIAISDPEVIGILGYRPLQTDMAPVPAGLMDTACSEGHLCAAPTFNLGDKMLWVMVDLTSEEVAGTAWTELAADPVQTAAPFVPTGCPPPGNVTRAGWNVSYNTTGTDGLRVHTVSFNGMPVANSIKWVEWHARYSSGTGYEDSTGCGGGGGGFPIYPYGDTVVSNILDVNDAIIGFEVTQDFRMSSWGSSCNYRYDQRVQFFNDGRFRAVSGAYGKGCGTTAVYRPVMRMDVDVNGTGNQSFATWNGANWAANAQEFWQLQAAPYDANLAKWRISNQDGNGYYLEPGQAQFGDNGRGDSGYIYVTQHKPAEGDTDLPIIGDCCFGDHRQGPEAYINNESISNQNLVLWYVPQMVTDVTVGNYYCWTLQGEPNPVTYPCFAGPMFVPQTHSQFSGPSTTEVAQAITLTSSSTGLLPLSYAWDFGDGSAVVTSTNASYAYPAPGTYTVTLTTTGANGESDTATQQVTVEAIVPLANFTDSGPYVLVDETVIFTNTTIAGESYLWDLGDGTLVTDTNPTHAYTQVGDYTVTLTATNGFGDDVATAVVSVGLAPTAQFSHDTLASVGNPVQFTNESSGMATLGYLWDFGDGTTSPDTDPAHTYTQSGTYTITLTTSNEFGDDVATAELFVGLAPTAQFSHDGPVGVGHPAQFNNSSTGTADLSYAWDFGDGATSSAMAPSHIYAATGEYTVSLSISNSWGVDAVAWPITVGEVVGVITPAGGGTITATTTGQVVTITVPVGGVQDELSIIYTSTAQDPALPNYQFTGVSFNLTAYLNQTALANPFAFEQPLSVDVGYEAADFIPASMMLVYWNGSTWVDAAVTCPANRAASPFGMAVCTTGDYALVGRVTQRLYLPLIVR